MNSSKIDINNKLLIVVMELAETNLSEIIKNEIQENGNVSERNRVKYWRMMLLAVKFYEDAYDSPYMFITPRNFLIVDNKVKLVDFLVDGFSDDQFWDYEDKDFVYLAPEIEPRGVNRKVLI